MRNHVRNYEYEMLKEAKYFILDNYWGDIDMGILQDLIKLSFVKMGKRKALKMKKYFIIVIDVGIFYDDDEEEYRFLMPPTWEVCKWCGWTRTQRENAMKKYFLKYRKEEEGEEEGEEDDEYDDEYDEE